MSSTQKPSSCVFCKASFSRPDALKRHWTTCKVRLAEDWELPQISSKARGRKRKACDRCARQKRACVLKNNRQTCQPCAVHSKECSYLRIADAAIENKDQEDDLNYFNSTAIRGESATHESSSGVSMGSIPQSDVQHNPCFSVAPQSFSWGFFKELTLGRRQNCRPTELNIPLVAEFPFLGRVSKAYGFVGTFECGSYEHRSEISKKLWKPYAYRDVSEGWRRDLPSDQVFSNYEQQVNPNIFPGQVDDGALLSIKTYEIVKAIRSAVVEKPKNSTITIAWSYQLEAMCYEFFCPTNIEKFLALYWSCWYPNWPTIHQPTFDSVTADFTLITAMVILGACLSPNQRDRVTAKVWFNVIEEIVFSHEMFSGNTICEDQDDNIVAFLSSHISILQAAYCVCLYQTWEGSKVSKRRVRRHRFDSIIWLARDIGFSHATLKSVNTADITDFGWNEFIIRESTIRLFTYIYDLDAAYAMFCGQPPRMLFQELNFDLTAPEACFQARSADECYVALKAWRQSQVDHENMTILLAVKALCHENIGKSGHFFATLSILNMFTIVSALYAIVFQVKNSPLPISDTMWIKTGLQNWGRLWPSPIRDEELSARFSESEPDGWKGVGFMRYAPEYWLLTNLVFNQMQRGPGHSVPKSLEGTRHDDTGMSQLNALVAEFRVKT
ncbi:hypothetical protein PISL3812_07452 [Talaromyces islandicus]|uniref:Zn(2)-C6 fungal-type domain-containing protein n=1 Tax=Talaromyces islandicus TaxID=28573 RepID=A0A0U1M483_TALIS|nr:hypothetical protein PISL3812_07452 [Talaromyces islandicus]